VKTNHLKFWPALLLMLCFSQMGVSQTITLSDKRKLKEKEDSLKIYARNISLDSTTAGRMKSDSQFTRTLVRALEIKNSFYYPFETVEGISKLYSPDTSFRIFTWTLAFDDYYSRQKGAIQLRTTDGSLKLIPLRDNSEFTTNPEDSVRTKDTWIGAVYYNIIKTQFKGKNYYTLFGYDNNSAMSSKKWIEVLTFNEKKEPIFGGPFFTYEKDSVKKAPQYRVSLEYKKEANALANYIDELQMILVDDLVSETEEPDNLWTYVPDGDNEGYKWENGKWVHVEKVFNYKIDMKGVDPMMGKPPVENPLFDNKGNRNEKKLEEQSDKNKTKDNNEN